VVVGRRLEALVEIGVGEPLVAEADRVVESVRSKYGRLDGLVNNAGIVRGGALGSVAASDVSELLATNLVAPIMLTHAATAAARVARRRGEREHGHRAAWVTEQTRCIRR
jgi:NAD(P)-dependent dehydrogenase (short-subunit alcohol dehydrogenase family)